VGRPEDHKAELIIALMDAWVLDPAVMKNLPLAVWTPVDHQPCPRAVGQFFALSGARTIAMSRFGEKMLHDEGLDPLYVPHGVDTKLFKPRSRDEMRDLLGVKDGFLVGIVANNSGGMPPSGGPPRKSFPQSLMAFSAFQKKHPDAVLFLHSELTGRPGLDNGLNLSNLIRRFEIPESALRGTSQLMMELGVNQVQMANLYSAMDVLLNPSYGEGFGIPIVEAQACGSPVIVTDWTAMPELCGSGWLVEGEPWYNPTHEAFFKAPFVGAILEALEQAYEHAAGMRDKAVEFAAQYDADKVTQEFWVPALEALSKPREVPPLPNRAHRRAAKKAGVAA
jgi:glycosyltransferase involved in cell wall biosynthesis